MPEVTWISPGESAARAALDGPDGFLSSERLRLYADKRNDPSTRALSNLSPYLHYGQLAPQRAALEAAKHRSKCVRGRVAHMGRGGVGGQSVGALCEYLAHTCRRTLLAARATAHGTPGGQALVQVRGRTC